MKTRARSIAAVQTLLLLIAGVALVRRAAAPPPVIEAPAPLTAFSADRAMAHVRAIAQRPHPTGSVENDRVRDYVLGELRALGLTLTVQETLGIGTRHRAVGRIRNILARLPGTANSGRAVMLASHYDSQGAAPGAGDAASGTAAILETVRALRAAPPLAHDVIVLITDGEEAGLLGAAAFAREHPWARDVDMILNFEARGTGGRSFMFETGAGNLDAARMLRRVADVSATSLMVMVYRLLPNDTDLSELMILGRPAMNFAFIDGVERYHTAHDDVVHLDPRSLQHHGNQSLALARAYATEPLPRVATDDAVFFDFPFAGLIVYRESSALPICMLAIGLVLVALWRTHARQPRWGVHAAVAIGGGAAVTTVGALVAVAASRAVAAVHGAMGWEGAPEWRPVYMAAVAALVFASTMGAWGLVRRRASLHGAAAGALVLWSALALLVTMMAPGASYVLVWPLAAAAIARIIVLTSESLLANAAAQLAGTAIVMAMLVPLVYLLGVALGLALPGALASALLTVLGAWLVAAHLESLAGSRRWLLPAAGLATSLLLFVAGAATVRADAAHPTRRSVVREIDVDTGGIAEPPLARVTADSSSGGRRYLALRIWGPGRTLALRMQSHARVLGASIDGRGIDTTRYRRRSDGWDMTYVAPPDSGFLVSLAVPGGAPLDLLLTARVAGVPSPDSAAVRSRTGAAVASGAGDATYRRRRLTLPAPSPR